MSFIITAYSPENPETIFFQEVRNDLKYAKMEASCLSREYPELSVVVASQGSLFAFFQSSL